MSPPEKQKKPFILFSGPSGVGKTTLIQHLLKRVQNLQAIVSYTTRFQRKDEKPGQSYFFIGLEEFLRKEKDGEFLESALIYDHHYAIDKGQLELSWKNLKIPIKDVDVQGLRSIKKIYPQCFSVGIFPPHKIQVEERIQKRNVDFGKGLKTRLEAQSKEIEELKKEVDLQLINDDIEKALETLQKEIESYLKKV